jgi:hypothetical protein
VRVWLGVLLVLVVAGCARGGGSEPSTGQPLPGAAPRTAALSERLRAALASKGASYRPHTRHLDPAGHARYVNRLILERSPYLLQHAHNPVDWYPWGDEAFARAAAERKLVLLSIGYSTCHWCHVMEEESFEDETIAGRLNADYVAIKVDREERPDVDDAYLQAVIALTGGGGWPMTVWLTPEREVVFAGTYFPPRDGERGARLGFATLLERLATRYRDDPQSMAAEGQALATRLRALAEVVPAEGVPGSALLRAAFLRYQAAFDRQYGGFGGAPKFPMPSALEFLLRYHRRTGEPAALVMVETTLDRMAAGGVRDQFGGGFHRYATDRAWRVPHFEKMLYDNAQLATLYLDALQVTGRRELADVAGEILDDLLRTFRAPGGGFAAATDADDPVGEGAFYLWTADEIAAQLDAAHAAAVRAHYLGPDTPQIAGKQLPMVTRSLADTAAAIGRDPQSLGVLLGEARPTLVAARATRPAPAIDTKVLAGWNGLAIGALARAGAILDEPRYVAAARAAAEFILTRMQPGGGLQRVPAGGAVDQPAFLEDYAFLASGLLDLYEATFDLRWLREAQALHVTLADDFWDAESGGYYQSGASRDRTLPRRKPADDGALPSGNAVAAENLVRLAALTGDESYSRRAAEVLRALGRGLTAAPTGAPRLLGVLEALLDRAREVVIVAPAAGDDDGRSALLAAVRRRYLPNRALVVAREGSELTVVRAALPLVGEKVAVDGRTTAYVCELGRCQAPTHDPEVLARQLAAVRPLPPPDTNGD